MIKENGANWKNSYAICSYKESKKPIPKIKIIKIQNKLVLACFIRCIALENKCNETSSRKRH